MQDQFLNYHYSGILKNLGFTSNCFGYYLDGILIPKKTKESDLLSAEKLDAPLFCQAIEWFKTKFDIPSYISVKWDDKLKSYEYYYVYYLNKKGWHSDSFASEKDALYALIDSLIRNITESKKKYQKRSFNDDLAKSLLD